MIIIIIISPSALAVWPPRPRCRPPARPPPQHGPHVPPSRPSEGGCPRRGVAMGSPVGDVGAYKDWFGRKRFSSFPCLPL
jgi:hypothetical protein